MKDNSGSAFPTLQTVNVPTYHTGLTKREYFAAMAMQGMTMWELKVDGTGYDWEKLAAWSFKMADAMLAEGRKP